MRDKLLLMLVGLVMGALVVPARAAKNDDAKDEVNRVWNVDQLMEQAARNIATRYNLNAHQREQTRELLVEEVSKFLDTHPDIWPLIRDLTRIQLEGQSPNPQVGARIAKQALPILREASEAIFQANDRWREILTPEQRNLHDWDLRDMERTFSKMESNFASLQAGAEGVKPELFPPPNRDPDQPGRPPRPGQQFQKDLPPERHEPTETWWERYVRSFIGEYELDDSQSEAALSILRECQQRARDYKQSKAKEFAESEARLKEVRRSGQPTEVQAARYKIWEQNNKRLRQPILDLFEELKARLEPIPTEAQRRIAEAKHLGHPTNGSTTSQPSAPPRSRVAPAAEKDKPNDSPTVPGESTQSPTP